LKKRDLLGPYSKEVRRSCPGRRHQGKVKSDSEQRVLPTQGWKKKKEPCGNSPNARRSKSERNPRRERDGGKKAFYLCRFRIWEEPGGDY